MNIRDLGGLLVALVASTAGAQSWPMNQGNAAHTGAVDQVIHVGSLSPRWVARLSSGPIQPVAAADGKVFASGSSRGLWALDAATGSELWHVQYPSSVRVNPPSYDQGRVFIQTSGNFSDGLLRSYAAANGTLRFETSYPTQTEWFYAPTIVAGDVYAGGGEFGGMHGYDGDQGNVLWFHRLRWAESWTPAVDRRFCYAYDRAGVHVIDRITGGLVDSIADPDAPPVLRVTDMAPVLGGRGDLIVVHAGRLVRFDLLGGSVSWAVTDAFEGQPAVDDGVVFVLDDDALEARRQDDGALLWTWQPATPHDLRHNVIATGQHVLVSSTTATWLVDRATHRQVFDHPVGGHLSIADDNLYIAARDGSVTALGFQQLANPTAVEPARVPYAVLPDRVTVRGHGFTRGGSLQVLVGGQQARDVVVRGDEELTCRPPDLGPGVHELRLTNRLGSRVLSGGLIYHPALVVAEPVQRGGWATFDLEVSASDHATLLIGTAHRPVAVPPFAGTFDLGLPVIVGHAAWWPAPRFRVSLAVPPDPALQGVTLHAQGFAIPNRPRDHAGAFTAAVPFTIR